MNARNSERGTEAEGRGLWERLSKVTRAPWLRPERPAGAGAFLAGDSELRRRRSRHPGAVARREPLGPKRALIQSVVAAAVGALVLSASGWASEGTEPSSEVATPMSSSAETLAFHHGLDPDTVLWPDRLTEPMKAWLRQQVPTTTPAAERIPRLLDALLGTEGLDLDFRQSPTGTAHDVFIERKANCLSFSFLFVAFARELGVEAGYVGVSGIGGYHKDGDLIVVSDHVASTYGAGPDARLVELRFGESTGDRQVQPLEDHEARVLFLVNRGAELIHAGDLDAAQHWLELAVELDPTQPRAWVNLGVAGRRRGDPAAAARAYRRAIEADGDFLGSYFNLAALLRQEDERGAGREILRLLDRADNRNPYFLLALGDQSLSEGQLEDARRFFRRAVRLDRQLAQTRAAMAEWALEEGATRRAARWLRRARDIDPDDPRVKRLEEKLVRIGAVPRPAVGREP